MWNGPCARATSPTFDFEALLKASVDRDDTEPAELDLFSLSPLSSPEATPSHSPAPSVNTTPFQSPTRKPVPLPIDEHMPGPSSAPLNNARTSVASRKARMKQQSHDNRRKHRQEERETMFALPKARDSVIKKYVDGASYIQSRANLEDSKKVTTTAYTGLDDRIRHCKIYKLHEVVGSGSQFGFKLIEWDGKTPMPILDEHGNVIGVLAGFPGSKEEWMALHKEGCAALEDARINCENRAGSDEHRRGHFDTLLSGVSHGGGQKRPGNLHNNDTNREIVEKLNSMAFFRRLARFSTSVVSTWAPNLYDYNVDHLGALHAHYAGLRRNFTSSIFAAASYNLGPQTLCFRHTDFGNLPYGWCSVTAMGSFNPKKGGHIVLWECGLVIEFPPGSTILLPSAVISHSNIAIDESETHFSFAQYTSGALFRWVENGFRNLKQYRASLSPSQLQELDRRNANRWSFGLSLLSRVKSVSRPL